MMFRAVVLYIIILAVLGFLVSLYSLLAVGRINEEIEDDKEDIDKKGE